MPGATFAKSETDRSHVYHEDRLRNKKLLVSRWGQIKGAGPRRRQYLEPQKVQIELVRPGARRLAAQILVASGNVIEFEYRRPICFHELRKFALCIVPKNDTVYDNMNNGVALRVSSCFAVFIVA